MAIDNASLQDVSFLPEDFSKSPEQRAADLVEAGAQSKALARSFARSTQRTFRNNDAKMDTLLRDLAGTMMPDVVVSHQAGAGNSLPEIESQRRYSGGVTNAASMGWSEAFNPGNSVGQRIIFGGLALAATPDMLVESVLYAPWNAAPAASETGQYLARASLQSDPDNRNLDLLRATATGAEAFNSAGAWISGPKPQAGLSHSSMELAALRATYTDSLTGVPINGATRTVPLGFQGEVQFIDAAQDLNRALVASGVDDAVIGARGSSVTGRSVEKGTTFGPQSDIDIFVESAQLTKGYKTSTKIPGFVHPNKILADYPLLQEWSTKWTKTLGRDITPGAFIPGKIPSQPAIIVKGGK